MIASLAMMCVCVWNWAMATFHTPTWESGWALLLLLPIAMHGWVFHGARRMSEDVVRSLTVAKLSGATEFVEIIAFGLRRCSLLLHSDCAIRD